MSQEPRRTPTRDQVHASTCLDSQCIAEGADPGKDCTALDRLLDKVEQDALQKLYQRLLNLHMGTLLTHGADVAGGLALGVREVHAMLPNAVAGEAVAEWAESTAAAAEPIAYTRASRWACRSCFDAGGTRTVKPGAATGVMRVGGPDLVVVCEGCGEGITLVVAQR
jgi:hypothetical protein